MNQVYRLVSMPFPKERQNVYIAEFSLPGLPKMTNNNSRLTWQAKMGESRKWKELVSEHVFFLCIQPQKPLKKAKLTLIRYSSSEPDTDGLVSGFKHIIDGLVVCGVLENDKPSNIGIPEYKWSYVPRKLGFVKIIIEEMT